MGYVNYRVVGADVFDGEAGGFFQRSFVVREGRIASEAEHWPSLDLGGFWVLPGLIDAHLHICGESDPVRAREFNFFEASALSLARARENLQRCLRFGVTTVRDVGSRNGRAMLLREGGRDQSGVGPRIFACGEFLVGDRDPSHGWCRPIERGQLVAAVHDAAKAGVNFIKIINDPPAFSIEELAASVALAHSLNLKVACHAFTTKAAAMAIEAGVDSIEHGSGWNEVLAQELLERDIALVPTAVAAYDVVSRPVSALSSGLGESDLAIFDGWWTDILEYLPRAIKRGLRIGVGSDSGFPPTSFGSSVWREMEVLHALGMAWTDCLSAATRTNAEILGNSDLGHLNCGACADFLIFGSNPIVFRAESIKMLAGVVVGGQLLWSKPSLARIWGRDERMLRKNGN